MMKVFNDADNMGVAIDLVEVEAVIQLADGFVTLITGNDSYRVKGDFDSVVKAVEFEKDARCI